MVKSVVVYSIAKMFTWTLCLYMAAYTYKPCESMENIYTALLEDIALEDLDRRNDYKNIKTPKMCVKVYFREQRRIS